MSIPGKMPDTVDCPRCGTPVPTGAVFCPQCGEEVEANGAADPDTRLRDRLTRAIGDRYRIGDVLGAGGMGVVFLADDLKSERKVAIKVLSPKLSADPRVVERFEREARTAAGLSHRGIVPTYEAGSEGGLHYLVMQYVAGRPLDEILKEQAAVPIAFATRVLCEAAAALAHAHRQGVVHRDVKPHNIIVEPSGRVLLADFGISKVVDATEDATTLKQLTKTGAIVGTPHYMAPEHALGQDVDGRSDQYALAVVGYQMLAGRVPFDDDSLPGILLLHINEAAPPLESLRPDVPPRLAAGIARSMSKARANRFDTMEAFAAAIAEPPSKRSARGAAWAAGLLLVAALGGGAWWAWQNGWALPGLSRSRSPALAPVSSAPAPRALVRLDVKSIPNATLYIDERRIGVTPIEDGRLSVGVHELRLERPGYRTRRDTVTVTATQSVRRNYVLRRQR